MQVPDWFDRPVSRETLDALETYSRLLDHWTRKINLISPTTRSDIENRHIWDSAQAYVPTEGTWLDLGSGAGLPGLVVAILARGEGSSARFSLVESDQRKATFLRTCLRDLSLNAEIICERIENVLPQDADVLSARALANLSTLLEYAERHMSSNGQCVFLKGGKWRAEIAEAKEKWHFSCTIRASLTAPEAAILTIKDIRRA